jgi:hypothetical protein
MVDLHRILAYSQILLGIQWHSIDLTKINSMTIHSINTPEKRPLQMPLDIAIVIKASKWCHLGELHKGPQLIALLVCL